MIKFLSDEVKAHLRSGIAICSLQQCVEELVLNSIDAGATCVAVKVDVEACKLQVVDNGSGIDRQDFDRLGNRYSTSKCSCLEDLENLTFYGFRGEALASIVSLSGVVEISSRTKLSMKTYVKVFDNGQSMGVSEAETARPSAGTTVTVSNFFCNMPVRRRRLDPVLEMERIRQRVEAISLMHPSVSFTVKKDCTGTVLVQLSKVKSTYYRFAQIHGLERAQKLREVTYLHGQFEITGHIGCDGHYNNNIQYVFINKRLLLKTCIHKFLNCLLSKYTTFNKQFGTPSVSLVTSSPKERTVGDHGMYVINIKCSCSEYDVSLEPAKTLVEFKDWDGLLYCLEESVRMFLKTESLLMSTPEDTQGCLDSPLVGERTAFSDTLCENSDQFVCTEFAGGKALASKPVHRSVAEDFTERGGDFKTSDKDTTEDKMEAKFEPEVAMGTKLEVETSSDAVSTLSATHSNIELNSVSVKSKDTDEDRETNQDSGYKACKGFLNLQREFESNKVKETIKANISGTAVATMQHNSSKRETASHICRQCFDADTAPSVFQVAPCHKLALSHVAGPLDKFRRMLGKVDETVHQCPEAHSNHVSLVNDTALPVKTDTHVANVSFHSKEQHKPNNSLPSAKVSALKLSTSSDCRSKKGSKITLSTQLSYLKQTKMKNCDSTSDELLNAIRNTNSCNRKRLLPSSIQIMNCGERALESTPLYTIFPKYNKDSPSTPRYDDKSSETHDLSHSLLSQHHADAISNAHSVLTAAPPATSADLNPNTDTCTSWTSPPADKFENDKGILPPPAATSESEEDHTDEAQQRDSQVPSSDTWLSHYDCVAGKVVYINKVTGLSKYDLTEEEQKVSCITDVTNVAVHVISKKGFESRSHPFQTKAVLPFLKSRTERVLSTGTGSKADAEATDALALLFSAWKNPVFVQPLDVAVVVASGENRLPVGIHNMPYRFTKDMIHSMKVIHQVDKKFLACLINAGNQGMSFNSKPEDSVANLLVLVDQHAAHERVRLEGLVAESYEDDPQQPGQKKLCSSVVSPPLEVAITQEELRLLRASQSLLSCLGLDVEFPHTDKPCVLLHKVPACFLEKENTNLCRGRPSVIKSLLEEYLREQIKLLHSTRRLQTTLPLTVHNVLASQACHGAVKFNHSLSQEECHSLVRSLATCQLPFQCAHGRPSITPIVDLQHLDNEQQDAPKPNLRKLRRMYNAWLIYGKENTSEKKS